MDGAETATDGRWTNHCPAKPDAVTEAPAAKWGANAPSDAPDGRNTATAQPDPMAMATLPQVPDPPPENEREARTPAGQPPEGKATSKPPAAAT